MTKQKLKSGWEWDWVSLYSRRITGWKAGVGKYIKKRMSKRRRADGKQEVRKVLIEQTDELE